jgi:hypothetical protein
VIGPHRPCGSIAMGSNIMFCFRRSPMTLLPMSNVLSGESSRLLHRMYFLRSNSLRCLSAKAVREGIAFSESSKSGIRAPLWAIVMSAPIVV